MTIHVRSTHSVGLKYSQTLYVGFSSNGTWSGVTRHRYECSTKCQMSKAILHSAFS